MADADHFTPRASRAILIAVAVTCALAAAVGYLLWQRSLRSTPAEIAAVMTATAELVGSLAWPLVAALVALLLLAGYPELIVSIAERFREGFGVKLGPPRQRPATPPGDIAQVLAPGPATSATEPVVSTGEPVAAAEGAPVRSHQDRHLVVEAMERLRTPEVRNMERIVAASPQVQNASDDAERLEVLTIMAAAFFVGIQHEKVEATIWESQLRALHALNLAPMDAENLRVRFFAPLAERVEAAKGYGFGNWLQYLRGSLLVEIEETTVSISDRGKDYLAWRLRSGKPDPPAAA